MLPIGFHLPSIFFPHSPGAWPRPPSVIGPDIELFSTVAAARPLGHGALAGRKYSFTLIEILLLPAY
jgi:hypothetical protein